MPVGEEDVPEGKAHSVAHHLALGPFAAVEQHRLALALNRDGGDVAVDGGAGGAGAEEGQGKHGREDTGDGRKEKGDGESLTGHRRQPLSISETAVTLSEAKGPERWDLYKRWVTASASYRSSSFWKCELLVPRLGPNYAPRALGPELACLARSGAGEPAFLGYATRW